MERLPEIFTDKRAKKNSNESSSQDRLYQQIGQLQVKLDWLKKPVSAIEARSGLISSDVASISIIRQCDLLGVSRSSYYHKPVSESSLNLELIRLIDQRYTN